MLLPHLKKGIHGKGVDHPPDGIVLVHGTFPGRDIVMPRAPVALDGDAEYLENGVSVIVEGSAGVGFAVAVLIAGADLPEGEPALPLSGQQPDQPEILVNQLRYHNIQI